MHDLWVREGKILKIVYGAQSIFFVVNPNMNNRLLHLKLFLCNSTVTKIYSHLSKNLFFYIADDVIGVHCTHGLNRTGYLICR